LKSYENKNIIHKREEGKKEEIKNNPNKIENI
jgi:hypothetical protein